MKLGIAGCGTIGSEIACAISENKIIGYNLIGLYDIDEDRTRQLIERLQKPVDILDLDALIGAADIIFEATNKSSMPMIAEKSITAGRQIMVMSVGGLAERPDLLDLAQKHGVNFICPSGAICGIDGILAAREAGLNKVQITSTKHPRGLKGSPYLVKNSISVDNLKKRKTVFEGTAREAIEGFPKNVNVSITLSFAGIGIDKTRVIIVADPNCTKTRHEIIAEGAFGSIHATSESVTSPGNPRTGYLAILSAMAMLNRIRTKARIGT